MFCILLRCKKERKKVKGAPQPAWRKWGRKWWSSFQACIIIYFFPLPPLVLPSSAKKQASPVRMTENRGCGGVKSSCASGPWSLNTGSGVGSENALPKHSTLRKERKTHTHTHNKTGSLPLFLSRCRSNYVSRKVLAQQAERYRSESTLTCG